MLFNKTKLDKFFISMILIHFFVFANGQENQRIEVIGQVFDSKAIGIPLSVMVVNKTTGQGNFGSSEGNFNLSLNKNDSIYISTRGYKMIKISFKDSVFKPIYKIAIPLSELSFQINTVEVFPQRDLNEIKEDIDKLGYNDKDYMLSGINAFQSPITFLYLAYSSKAQKERLAYELQNQDKRRELLKELFVKYVQHDIIDLETSQFDDFIDFCRITDEQMKRMSQYDFIMYIKDRYHIYSIVRDEDYYRK
jgi:hypothetical protein